MELILKPSMKATISWGPGVAILADCLAFLGCGESQRLASRALNALSGGILLPAPKRLRTLCMNKLGCAWGVLCRVHPAVGHRGDWQSEWDGRTCVRTLTARR